MKQFDLRGNCTFPGDNGIGHVERVEDKDASFWSVYEMEEDGSWMWLADFDSRVNAVEWKLYKEWKESERGWGFGYAD